MRSWPTNSASRRGRSDLLEVFFLGHDGRREELGAHYAAFSASRTRSSGDSSGSTRASAMLRLADGVAELDERVAGDEMRLRSSRPTRSAPAPRRASPSARARSAPPSSCRSRGCAWKRARVLEHDRAAQVRRGRAGHDRERDLRADAVHGQQLHEQLPLGRLREAVELQRVLAHVQVRVQRRPRRRRRPARTADGVAATR